MYAHGKLRKLSGVDIQLIVSGGFLSAKEQDWAIMKTLLVLFIYIYVLNVE